MNKIPIEKLMLLPVRWLANSGPDEDIAISTRIRLARNISGLSFPVNSSESEQEQIRSIITSTIKI